MNMVYSVGSLIYNILKSIINNQMDKRLLAFSTDYVQGKIIKQNIKSMNVEI